MASARQNCYSSARNLPDPFERSERMNPVVAVIAPGMMGAAVGGRLVENGLKVLTSLTGRSAETVARAKRYGLAAAADEEIARADFILSILPPGDAVALAERFAPALTASNSKPVFVECNALSPRTAEKVAAVIAPTGAPFVDAGIIGSPPKTGDNDPRFYASGPAAARFATLRQYGLDVRVLEGPLTAASAMKMSYAGITKGTQALAAVMMLAATRAGTADALFAELSTSQAPMLAWLKRSLALMPPKAYRWIAEMHEIADFVGEDPAGHELYVGAAHFYERIAEDFAGDQQTVAALTAFLNKGAGS
jgi:3-hydroxyisobutyrate dehydrogenase-like beta-hydroxyacid dehydrogenase